MAESDPVLAADPAEAPDLGLAVSVDSFSGPLDLLLFLVRKDELDIRDIPLAGIADQFVALVRAWQERGELDLELAGDFILMAATLLEIKARAVAPPLIEEGEDTQDDGADELLDPRQGLIGKLLAYRRFKEAVGFLTHLEEDRALRHTRRFREELPEDPEEAAGIDLGALDSGLLFTLWDDLLKRLGGKGPRTVLKDDIPLEVTVEKLVEAARVAGTTTLGTLLQNEPGLLGRVTLLIATLETARKRVVEAKQREQYGEVDLRFRPEEERTGPPPELPPEVPWRKRQRKPPLVTYTAIVAGEEEEGAEQEPEAPYETDEQRFMRELNERCDLDGVLARSVDVEAGFLEHWYTLFPDKRPKPPEPEPVPIPEAVPVQETLLFSPLPPAHPVPETPPVPEPVVPVAEAPPLPVEVVATPEPVVEAVVPVAEAPPLLVEVVPTPEPVVEAVVPVAEVAPVPVESPALVEAVASPTPEPVVEPALLVDSPVPVEPVQEPVVEPVPVEPVVEPVPVEPVVELVPEPVPSPEVVAEPVADRDPVAISAPEAVPLAMEPMEPLVTEAVIEPVGIEPTLPSEPVAELPGPVLEAAPVADELSLPAVIVAPDVLVESVAEYALVPEPTIVVAVEELSVTAIIPAEPPVSESEPVQAEPIAVAPAAVEIVPEPEVPAVEPLAVEVSEPILDIPVISTEPEVVEDALEFAVEPSSLVEPAPVELVDVVVPPTDQAEPAPVVEVPALLPVSETVELEPVAIASRDHHLPEAVIDREVVEPPAPEPVVVISVPVAEPTVHPEPVVAEVLSVPETALPAPTLSTPALAALTLPPEAPSAPTTSFVPLLTALVMTSALVLGWWTFRIPAVPRPAEVVVAAPAWPPARDWFAVAAPWTFLPDGVFLPEPAPVVVAWPPARDWFAVPEVWSFLPEEAFLVPWPPVRDWLRVDPPWSFLPEEAFRPSWPPARNWWLVAEPWTFLPPAP